jgi:hypothetical protein
MSRSRRILGVVAKGLLSASSLWTVSCSDTISSLASSSEILVELGLERLYRGAVIGRSQRLPVGHLQDAVRAVSLVAHLAQLAPKLGDLMIHVPPAFLHLFLDGLSGS